MFELVKGNLFDSPFTCLVNPTNSIGVMGAGLAKQFRDRFPLVCDSYNSLCKYKQSLTGKREADLLCPYLYERTTWNEEKHILMFPTKKHWKEPSKIEYIDRNLPLAFVLLEKAGIVEVAFPLLGCGLGGLQKEEVLPLIEKHSKHFKGRVAVHVS